MRSFEKLEQLIDSTLGGTLSVDQTGFRPEYDGLSLREPGGVVSGGTRYSAVLVSGEKDMVYSVASSCAPLLTAGETVYFLPVASLLQLTSTSTLDVGGSGGATSILIVGVSGSFTPISEVVSLTGQTPSTTTLTFLRVNTIVVQTSERTDPLTPGSVGDIYLTPNGQPTTLGVPDNRSTILMTMKANTGLGYNCAYSIMPGQQLYFSELVVSSDNQVNQDDTTIVEFMSKTGNSGWRTIARLLASTTQPIIDLHQGSFPGISTNPTEITDFMLLVHRLGGGSNNYILNIYLTGFLVEPA